MMRNDPFIPLDPARIYYSKGAAEAEQWLSCTGAQLQALLDSSPPPAYRTILGLSEPFEEGKAAEYAGPFYLDLDCDMERGGITVAIRNANTTLDGLAAWGVDLGAVRLFLTGGRGFHIEVPAAIFGGNAAPILPAIYRSMAKALATESTDFRVYSARKGRMWRVPNVRRANGAYKVPVTVEQVRSLTPDGYALLTSQPRPFPPLNAPVLAPGMAEAYRAAKDQAAAEAQRVKPHPKAAINLRVRFKGALPPSVAALCAGKFPAHPDRGWNQVCLQLALTAQAVGMGKDALLSACDGLIARHKSDGSRYRTQHDRERELAAQYRYAERSGYSFSVAGIRSILPPGINCRDLIGLEG
jgi:hypothetical protein